MSFEQFVEKASERPQQAFEDLEVPEAKIIVIGTGGAGNNTVTRLMEMGGVYGAETICMNTDKQHLRITKADKKLLIGYELTRGLGAGGYPEVGKESAVESKQEIKELVDASSLVFLSTGLGGGTGTGSAPVIAEIAKQSGAIVIGVTTMPFNMEKARIVKAEEGLLRMREVSDTVIVIDNNKLVEYCPDLPLNKAFAVADELIATMIKGISETITKPSLVNLDFADIRAIMSNGGVAMIGVGESNTKNRAEESVQDALKHPLLEVDYRGASGALLHITGGEDMTLSEVTYIGETVSENLDPAAQVIWGARIDPDYAGKIRVITVLTGVHSPQILGKIGKQRADDEVSRIQSSERQPVMPQMPRRKPALLKELDIDYVF